MCKWKLLTRIKLDRDTTGVYSNSQRKTILPFIAQKTHRALITAIAAVPGLKYRNVQLTKSL